MSNHPLIDALQKEPDRAAHHNGWSLEAERATTGTVGLQAEALRLRRERPSAQDAPALARGLAKRATYLLEPLDVVESEGHKALLRSREPDDEAGPRDYYDVWVTPDDLSVQRYHNQPGQRREPRPLNLTWEQAERLVRDAERVYAGEPAS